MNKNLDFFIFPVVLMLIGSCEYGMGTTVRLVNGPNTYTGRVEVYHNGYGTICDDIFDTKEGAVICRMLGYQLFVPRVYGSAHFGEGGGTILMDSLNCKGNETDIGDCPFDGWGVNDCSHSEDASVSCEAIQLRLVGGKNKFEGRLEIKKLGGAWGTVTSRDFTVADANIICQYIATTGSFAEMFTDNRYGSGSGVVYKVSSGHLKYPTSDPFLTTSSSHDSDIGIKCWVYVRPTAKVIYGQEKLIKKEKPAHTEVRLVGGRRPTEGRVEVLHNGVWGSVCDAGFSSQDAEVVCSSLGLDNAYGAVRARHAGAFGKGQGPVWLSNLHCNGREHDLQSCSGMAWSSHACATGNDAAVECAYTPIRLSGGVGPWEGRLEVYHHGSGWGTVCSQGFDRNDAETVCRLLGYRVRDVEPEVLPNAYFSGLSSLRILLDNLGCTGSEMDITACMTQNWEQTNCTSRQDVGVRCQNKVVRLVDGSHPLEGRVEVNMNGTWGSVCDQNWDDRDATTVCKMLLEYPIDQHVSGKAYSGGTFGAGNGPVVLSDVQCNGTEIDLFHCKLGTSRRVNCDHSKDAGMECSINTHWSLINNEGHINEKEGSVQMTDFVGTHGICDEDWGREEAMTVCRSLGYWVLRPINSLGHLRTRMVNEEGETRSTSPTVYKDDWFGRHSLTVYNLLPQCHGNEVDMSFCKLGNEPGRVSCGASDTAGVRCTPSPLGFQNVELVDGSSPGSGRLDVRYNNLWGSVCYDNWTDADSEVVCQMLRFRNHNSTHRPVHQGQRPLLVGDLDCFGNETDIGLCKANLSKSGCRGNAVHVDCADGIDVRVDNSAPLGGKLEMLKNGVWRPVCYDGVDTNAAKVFCEMLGFRHRYLDPTVSYSTVSGGGSFPVVIKAGACSGWERHIGQCSSPLQITDQCVSNRVATLRCSNCFKAYTAESGVLLSDHYPVYYNNLTDCLYVIKPQNNQTVYKLQIDDLNMADVNDYVEIREGENGPLLGTLSVGNQFPIFAGKEFMIRFVTNSEISGRGFNITWSPLTIEDAMMVHCGPTGWNTVVNMTLLRQLYPDSGVSQIYLTTQSCTGTVVDDLLIFDQSYTDCDSTKLVGDHNIIYHNQLVYPESTIPFPIVVHGYRWMVDIECDVNRYATVAQHYKPTVATTTASNGGTYHHIGGNANYKTQIKFFKDPGYFLELKGNPISANVGDNVYVQVSTTNNDPNIKMRLESCVAKPSSTAGPSQTYTLIQNGCVVDTATRIVSQGSHQTRFLFNAFEFPENHDAVYVFCNTTFCDVTDQSQSCSQTCSHRRKTSELPGSITRLQGHTIDIYAWMDG